MQTPLVTSRPALRYAGAEAILAAGLKRAEEKNVPVAIAVVDEGGTQIAFARQDGSLLVAVSLSLEKAETALRVRRATHELWSLVSADPVMKTGIAGHPNLLAIGGGVPVVADGAVVGAVGVSGGSYEDDTAIAEAAVAAISAAVAT